MYAEFDRLGLGREPDELDRLSGAVRGAGHDQTLLAERLLHNDLETAARSLCPPIGDALADVRASGAVRAMVAGSGPTVIGLFPGPDGVTHAEAAAAALRPRHPGAACAAPVGREFGRPRADRAVKPLWLAGAAALVAYLVVRRRSHGPTVLIAGAVAAAGAFLIGLGVIGLPNLEQLIEDLGARLGKWTYLLVGVMAFLETGAFVGLVAPGETTVIVGGLVAGQGQISLLVLIAIVWTAAVLGDLTSYLLGRRLGRGFMLRHGPRVKITEERLEQVEGFFAQARRRDDPRRAVHRPRARAGAVHRRRRRACRCGRFLPYDVLGAGAWAVTFCVLGYVFWRSFDRLTEWVSRGLFAFGTGVALILGDHLRVPPGAQRGPAPEHARLARRPVRAPAAAPGWRRTCAPSGSARSGPWPSARHARSGSCRAGSPRATSGWS